MSCIPFSSLSLGSADIFRAVQQGAASVMLTGETAVGEYPLEAMEVLVDTVREAEWYLEERR